MQFNSTAYNHEFFISLSSALKIDTSEEIYDKSIKDLGMFYYCQK